MDKKPTVGILGATGYVGKFLTKAFLEQLSRFSTIRILSTKEKDGTELAGGNAETCVVNYTDAESLQKAFLGLNIVISALGDGPWTNYALAAIITALSNSPSVKVYIPSEFGTNHYMRCKEYSHPVFTRKQEHFLQCKKQLPNITTIRLISNPIMEFQAFKKWYGFDKNANTWTIVGDGLTPVAMTGERDIGRFTVESVLQAWKNPVKIPDLVEFYGDVKTGIEIVEIFEKVQWQKISVSYVPISDARKKLDEMDESSYDHFELSILTLMAEGAYNASDANGNKILNDGEKIWKLKKFEDYAKETGGKP